jgi:hypothetical protein
MRRTDKYKVQENRLSDPRDEFSDEYKGEDGENEGHGEMVGSRASWPLTIVGCPCDSAPLYKCAM